MDRLLLSILDEKTREELLFTHDLTLVKAIEICRAREAATLHMKALESEEINKVRGITKPEKPAKFSKHRGPTKDKPRQPENPKAATKTSHFCTHVDVMRRESCPAWESHARPVVERTILLLQRNVNVQTSMVYWKTMPLSHRTVALKLSVL